MEVTSQRPQAQDAATHEVRTPAAAGIVSGPIERVPQRVARPSGKQSLNYAQSEGDVGRTCSGP